MSFPKKQSVAVAQNQRSTFPLNCKHITTSDFMQLNIANAFELVPNQSVDINHLTFSRLEPLAVPTFGRAEIRHRAFWVPYRTVFPAFTDFITDTTHTYNDGTVGIVSNVPLITNKVLCEFYVMSQISTEKQSNAGYDFEYVNNQGDKKYYQLTKLGRFAHKILRSLGYAPLLNYAINKSYSAMPLLCLMRLYKDWYHNPQYVDTSVMGIFEQLFTQNNAPTLASHFNANQLHIVFNTMSRISYDADYFTSAWDNPNGPNTGLSSNLSVNDINGPDINSNDSYSVRPDNYRDTNSPSIGTSNGGALYNISQYALNALRAMTDYMKRHQIAGSRALDRYLSRFGVTLKAEKLNRSVLISTYSQDIQFGDVTSMASTDGASLGDYAGKGLSLGKSSFNFKTDDEFGMLFIVTTIIPEIDYFQGMSRFVNHLTKLDFFTPEYDALGVQAQASTELFVPFGEQGIDTPTNVYANQVFGFVPRYAEYKVGRSMLTGDFVLNTLNTGKDSWYLARDVQEIAPSLSNVVHDFDFVTSADSEQYNRIFQVTDDNADHFNIIHNFDIKTSFPGASLFDTYEFKDEDKSKKVTMDVNGTLVS